MDNAVRDYGPAMSTVFPVTPPGAIQTHVLGEVRAWMGRRGVNQTNLAAALGISQSQMSKRLRGTITLDVVELSKIAAYLDVALATLFDGYVPPRDPDDGGSVDTPRYPVLTAA